MSCETFERGSPSTAPLGLRQRSRRAATSFDPRGDEASVRNIKPAECRVGFGDDAGPRQWQRSHGTSE